MEENPKYKNEYDLLYPEAVAYPYPRMSISDRAAQFASFKALTGYEDAVGEAARLTDARIEFDENAMELLNVSMRILQEHIAEKPEITVIYFLPDKRKKGGKYVAVSGRIKRIDAYERTLYFTDNRTVSMDDILSVDGEVFDEMNENWME